MKKPRELTDSERTTITNGLHVAAHTYSEDAGEPDGTRLHAQFKKQEMEALALADLIDNAETLTIVEGEL